MDTTQKIQKILENTGKTQTELATMLGVTFVTLNAWLHGKSTPRKAAQEKIDALYKKYERIVPAARVKRSEQNHNPELVTELRQVFTRIIAETNGITLMNTLRLVRQQRPEEMSQEALEAIEEFTQLLLHFQINELNIDVLLEHPVSEALFHYFKGFPIPFVEQHTHLTGALDEEFVFPRLQKALQGPHADRIIEQAQQVYGADIREAKSPDDLRTFMRLQEGHAFVEYLKRIFLTKVVLTTREAHKEAAYHMANQLYTQFNVGKIRLKWQFSRANSMGKPAEEIPGIEGLTPEDVTLGLYEGFAQFQKEHPQFEFFLCPSFRKEEDFFDAGSFETKAEDVKAQVQQILELLEKHPELRPYMNGVDTVGNEVNFYSKHSFALFKEAFRKLQFNGFQIRSHHGETWKTLRRGIQSVDNALNMWAVDAIEHGVSMGVNPNYYFHQMFQAAMEKNVAGEAIDTSSSLGEELVDMDWRTHGAILDKLLQGEKLSEDEVILFTKTKFHTSREVERYQHDVLNRLIDTGVELVSLPSSNFKLTTQFGDYKEHPFSWWEKKGMKLSLGTDNYVILDSNFIREMMILLYTDAANLKIMKLLMVATGEKRRPYMSNLLWQMNKDENL